MTEPSKFWIPVWNGLVNDPKHRITMGGAIWTYLNLLDWCKPETGKLTFCTYDSMSERSGISAATIRKHVKRLDDRGYIIVKRFIRGMHIEIKNYRPLRPSTDGQSNVRPSTDGRSQSYDCPNMDDHLSKNGQSKIKKQNPITKQKDISPFQESAEAVYQQYRDTVRPGAKSDAVKSILHLIQKEGLTAEQLTAAIDHYKQSQDFSTDKQYRIQANNFFGSKRRFEDYLEPPENNNSPDDVPEEWHKSARQRKKEMGLI